MKAFLVKTAQRRRVYPVTLLGEIVKEKFNPYGHSDVKDSVEYVRMLRQRSRKRSNASFLGEIRTTALEKRLPLMTRNWRHFRRVTGLALYSGR